LNSFKGQTKATILELVPGSHLTVRNQDKNTPENVKPRLKMLPRIRSRHPKKPKWPPC